MSKILIDRVVVERALEFIEQVHEGEWTGTVSRDDTVSNLRAALTAPAEQQEPADRGNHVHSLLAWIIDECVVYPESPDEKAFAKRLLDAITHPKSGYTAPQPAKREPEPVEMSPEFTDTARAALAEPAEQEPVAWFDSGGKIHGRVSKEQLVTLCTEALTQLGERYVALADYKELQALVSRQGIRLMEYESQPIEPAEQEPGNWSVYNSGAEVASGLSFAEAREYLTPERLARQWCAVCVVDQSNLPTAPQPAKRQPLTDEEIDAARGAT